MLYDLLQTKHIYIVCGKTDLRKGIDGLASLIQQEYQLELYEDAVFILREPSRPFQTSLLGR
jgi:transposase